MGIVYACITPHGGEVIPELAQVGAAGGGTAVGAPAGVGGPATLSEALRKFANLTQAMEKIGRHVREADPDTIVVATPHNLRLDGGYTAVVTSAFTSGTLAGEAPTGAGGGFPPTTVEASFPCDRELAADIVARARGAKIPVVGVNFGGLSGPVSLVPLDWGALIPLYFMGRRTEEGGEPAGEGGRTSPREISVGPLEGDRPKVVLIGPSRDVPRESLVELGNLVAEAAEASGRRVAFVASADQGHAHLAEGPYGFDPASAVYDSLIQDIVREGRLEDLLGIDPDLVEAGKPDSLWQMLILLGVLRRLEALGRPLKGEFLGYEVPTYFGMLCASYRS